MAVITLKPELKTSGGEVSALLLDRRMIGTATLVYREGSRLSGAVQLDKGALSDKERAEAVQTVKRYIRQLAEALQADEGEVLVMHGSCEPVLAWGPPRERWLTDELHYAQSPYAFDSEEADEGEDEWQLEDVDPDEIDTIQMKRTQWDAGYMEYADDEEDEEDDVDEDREQLELVIVSESRNRVEYELEDETETTVATAYMRIYGANVVGECNWLFEPSEQEIEQAVEQLVSDFDADEVDSFIIRMMADGEVLETIELTHEDLLDDDEPMIGANSRTGTSRSYSVFLVRDDGDTLTYNVYEEEHGGLPVGQATVDTGSRELTGYIDFRDEDCSDDREHIAGLLMQELDKTKDYRSLNLTMLLHNEPIDEIRFEGGTFH